MIGDNSKMDALLQRYAASLPGKHADVADAWAAYRAAPHSDAALRELTMQAHRLAGSAGSYGYEAIGHAAGVVDRLATQALNEPRVAVGVPLAAAVAALLAAIDAADRSR